MKLEYIGGRVCGRLNIDGVETIDMSINDLSGIIQIILARCDDISIVQDDISIVQDVLKLLIDEMGKHEHSEKPCEECGDYITTRTLII